MARTVFGRPCPYCLWLSTGAIVRGARHVPCSPRHAHMVEIHLYGNPWDMRPCAECRRFATAPHPALTFDEPGPSVTVVPPVDGMGGTVPPIVEPAGSSVTNTYALPPGGL